MNEIALVWENDRQLVAELSLAIGPEAHAIKSVTISATIASRYRRKEGRIFSEVEILEGALEILKVAKENQAADE